MRDIFHEELDGINQSLIALGLLTQQALDSATHALLTADLALAEKVIDDDDKVDEAQHLLDAQTIDLMARQQPVASDLRALVTSLRMSADLERMGDMAHHIAKLARMRHPATAVPPELLLTVQEMGRVASKIVGKAVGLELHHVFQAAGRNLLVVARVVAAGEGVLLPSQRGHAARESGALDERRSARARWHAGLRARHQQAGRARRGAHGAAQVHRAVLSGGGPGRPRPA